MFLGKKKQGTKLFDSITTPRSSIQVSINHTHGDRTLRMLFGNGRDVPSMAD